MAEKNDIPQGPGPKTETQNKKKQTAYFPQLKTFVFKRKWWQKKLTAEQIDEMTNAFMKEKALAGNAPMPGKCFSNHKTGEIVYVIAYTDKEEI